MLLGVDMKNIYDMTLEDLETYFESIGSKKFKARQVYDWLYKKRVTSFNDMTNIKKEVIDTLEKDFTFTRLEIVTKQEDELVAKYLFNLQDNNKIEAVLMRHDYGNSLCVSSQVGCNMSCHFCESGRLKKVRDLLPHEMVLQILQVEEDLHERISRVVIMGIGEPFDNYQNVIAFINIINSDLGIALGSRHITISTCGLVPKIKEFTKLNKQVNLAISLHAPNNDIRNQLMPINKVYPLEVLIPCVKDYIKKTNRRVTFEYILLKDVNDKQEHAIELANLLKGMNAYVNLIPYNTTSHSEYKKSDKKVIDTFYDTLKKHKIEVTIRKEFGSKVDAACGQLRANYKED